MLGAPYSTHASPSGSPPPAPPPQLHPHGGGWSSLGLACRFPAVPSCTAGSVQCVAASLPPSPSWGCPCAPPSWLGCGVGAVLGLSCLVLGWGGVGGLFCAPHRLFPPPQLSGWHRGFL